MESTKENTSGSNSSLKKRIWFKIDQRILHTRRYTELGTDLGSQSCTRLPLGTDVRYTYVLVGVKMHAYYTISKHRYELRFDILSNNAPTNTSYDGGLQFFPTFRLRCLGTSKKFRKNCLFAPLFEQYVFVNFSTIGTKLGRRCQWAPTMLVRRSDESLRAFLGFGLGTDTNSAKTVLLTLFSQIG